MTDKSECCECGHLKKDHMTEVPPIICLKKNCSCLAFNPYTIASKPETIITSMRSDPEIMKQIESGLEARREGKVVSWEEVKGRFEQAEKPDASHDRLITWELFYPKHEHPHGVENTKPAEHRIWVCTECPHIFVDAEIRADAESENWGHACKSYPCKKGQRCESHLEPYLPELPIYPIAFEAGRKEQVEKDRQSQEEWQADFTEKTATKYEERCNQIEAKCGNTIIEAKKQGAKELIEWINSPCLYHKEGLGLPSKMNCRKCWQAKLKELGL